jgi:hypothetical protein
MGPDPDRSVTRPKAGCQRLLHRWLARSGRVVVCYVTKEVVL